MQNKRIKLVLFFILLISILFILTTQTNILKNFTLSQCRNYSSEDKQIECAYKIITDKMQTEGIASGVQYFAKAYNSLDSFKVTTYGQWCHEHAHYLGDWAYYNLYRSLGKDISDIDFSEATTMCRFGFFHAFIEHLTQDHPNPTFIDQFCKELGIQLNIATKVIQHNCYHGAGHGFALAQADSISKDMWGNFYIFIQKPITNCASLEHANQIAIEACWRGAIDTVAEWISKKEYGFSYNRNELFKQCSMLKKRVAGICYMVMALEFSNINSVETLKDIFVSLPIDEDIKINFFHGGISTMVTNTNNKKEYKYRETLAECGSLNKILYKECLLGIISGLLASGTPQEEYREALSFCSEKIIEQRGLENFCYEKIIKYLPIFYTSNHIVLICSQFPKSLYKKCKAK